ncbi:MAG: peroxidase family protein, partial [Wenzhouxiangellaceae bacterium]|nr:peroxidase family protein [Wenzhouxiangellaceae bacterium]
GANGARVRLEPQINWPANSPNELKQVLAALEGVKTRFNEQADGGKRVSLADVIVLGGAAAIEKAARDAGHDVTVPFAPGRTDATPEMTDVASFAELEPHADAFRNYYSDGAYLPPAEMLVERADLLTLTVPEMTVLIGGMRALGANANGAAHGVLTDRPGVLTNDFFVNLMGIETRWSRADEDGIYEGRDRASGELKWTATPVDLIFGANAELRAIAEVYAAADGEQLFVDDFIAAWHKVMTLDRFDG